jgi:hypothetical protein
VLRWTSGAAAAALIGAGGTLAGLKLGGAAPAPANAAQAVALNNALSAPAAHRVHVLRLVRGMYGQVAFHGKAGTVTLAFERGTVESASGGRLVLRAADRTTWTWALTSNSVVREHGKTVPSSTLSQGSWVFTAGQVSGATRNARLIIIKTATARAAGPALPRGGPAA